MLEVRRSAEGATHRSLGGVRPAQDALRRGRGSPAVCQDTDEGQSGARHRPRDLLLRDLNVDSVGRAMCEYARYYMGARPSQAIHGIPEPYPELRPPPPGDWKARSSSRSWRHSSRLSTRGLS